ncbi:hypothetical protein GGX14DRAFT_656241 [Mycena pura]|uniref:Uncharacterized protein n=1 Tax=Mycena pura TaxID=153505 RepID=A0AAD6V6X5_9AGAR|nr:hypothetical protein GGX14DRAFT_656241 [Mycena pura]
MSTVPQPIIDLLKKLDQERQSRNAKKASRRAGPFIEEGVSADEEDVVTPALAAFAAAPGLDGFTPLPSHIMYSRLHHLLWPRQDLVTQPQPEAADLPACVPARLRQYIKSTKPDLSIWSLEQKDESTPLDTQAPFVHYIDLGENPTFKFTPLLRSPELSSMFLVRQDYLEFAEHHIEKLTYKRMFLTGQPGIGDLGAHYLVFHLLASGRPVFFISEPDKVIYFSEDGVYQVAPSIEIGDDDIQDTVSRSWVIIDLNIRGDWQPFSWVRTAAVVVWASSPQNTRMSDFVKNYSAVPWYMATWTFEEIAVLTKWDKLDPHDILARYRRSGPIAQIIFSNPFTLSDKAIDDDIRLSLAKSTNELLPEKQLLHMGDTFTNCVYLIEPRENAETGVLDRYNFRLTYLSNNIATRVAAITVQQLREVQKWLSRLLDNPEMRADAGKLFERIFHHALTHRTDPIDAEAIFGIKLGAEIGLLEMLGKAETFILETHDASQRKCRPLYLKPQSSSFAAVDAILVTSSTVFLIQCSLRKTHAHTIPTLLRILARIEANQIPLTGLQVKYCLMGIEESPRVIQLISDTCNKLELSKAGPDAEELKSLPQKVRARVDKLQVMGVIFDTEKNNLVRVSEVSSSEYEEL